MKKVLNLIGVFLIVTSFFQISVFPINAESVNSPEDLIVDPECARRLLIGEGIFDDEGKPICNSRCKRSIVEARQYCEYGTTDSPRVWDQDLSIPIEVGSSDALLIYLRAAIYAVLGLVALGVILFGIFGWYKHAMSEGNPEKVQEVRKIYTNAIIGAIIVIMSFVVVQLLSNFLGVTDSVFDFTFIPKSGYTVEVSEFDTGRVCYEQQIDKDGSHSCVEGKWVPN